MRISDWSSDVCSSDLHGVGEDARSGDAPAKSDHAQQLIANAEDEPAETPGQHQQHEENPDTARECLPLTRPEPLCALEVEGAESGSRQARDTTHHHRSKDDAAPAGREGVGSEMLLVVDGPP